MELKLKDNRILAYAEYGDLRGFPTFFFHGIPGSRIFRPPLDDVTARMGIRLITVDRPGYGLSSFQPKRTFLDFVNDIAQLADALELKKFAVLSHSGGAPYVAACALKIPQRLTFAGFLSAMLPVDDPAALAGMMSTNRMGLKMGRYFPYPIWVLLMNAFYSKGREHPEALMKPNQKNPQDPDNAMFAIPGALEICRASVSEAFRQGMHGHAWEAYLHVHPLGFRLEDITMPVHLWHGEADVDAPAGIGRHIAAKIPHCTAAFYPGEGHLLLFKHWEEILAAVQSTVA
jgi:pimeloyl-ACP methyl ester carboxylesterase